MKHLADKYDFDEISKDCDRVMKFMRDRYVDSETLDSLARICLFVQRFKSSMDWIENLIEAIKKLESDESIRQEIRKEVK